MAKIQKQHMSGLFALAMGAVFFMSAAWAMVASYGQASPQNAGDYINGKWASAYEGEFDENIFHYEPSKAFWDLKSFMVFQEGRDGVVIGEDGWLFTSEEFDRTPNFQANIETNTKFIEKVSQQLEAQNINLFIVPVPSKARLLEDKLTRASVPRYRKRVYANFLSTLNEKKVEHVDLAFYIQEPEKFFLKTDTHWTSVGAKLAAQKAAMIIYERDLYVKSNTSFVSEPKGAVKAHEGDLMRYTVSGKTAQIAGLSADKIQEYQTISNDIASDDLFGDQTIDAVLVGTSYSANKEWNFEGALKEALQSDLLNMADEGLGPFETMQRYLNSSVFKDSPPKLVIWEIPERFLPVSYDLKNIEENNV